MYLTIPQFFACTVNRFPDRTAVRNTRAKTHDLHKAVEWEIARIPYVEEVVEAEIYPNEERLKQDGHLANRRKAIWEAIKQRQGRLAHHKRIRRKEDIILVDRPFSKTSTMDIKCHLYKGGNHVSDD